MLDPADLHKVVQGQQLQAVRRWWRRSPGSATRRASYGTLPALAQEINGEDDDASLEVDDMEEWLETHALMMSEITACGTTASVITHHIMTSSLITS